MSVAPLLRSAIVTAANGWTALPRWWAVGHGSGDGRRHRRIGVDHGGGGVAVALVQALLSR